MIRCTLLGSCARIAACAYLPTGYLRRDDLQPRARHATPGSPGACGSCCERGALVDLLSQSLGVPRRRRRPVTRPAVSWSRAEPFTGQSGRRACRACSRCRDRDAARGVAQDSQLTDMTAQRHESAPRSQKDRTTERRQVPAELTPFHSPSVLLATAPPTLFPVTAHESRQSRAVQQQPLRLRVRLPAHRRTSHGHAAVRQQPDGGAARLLAHRRPGCTTIGLSRRRDPQIASASR